MLLWWALIERLAWYLTSYAGFPNQTLVLLLHLAAEMEAYGRDFLYGIHMWKVDAKLRTKRLVA